MKPADLVRPEILALSAYHVAEADGMVKLDAMENPYRLPEHLARELASRLAHVEINRYPNPAAPRLRARLREAMRIPQGCDVVLGNGSDDLIQIVSFTLARPGAVMLTAEPTFVVYKMNANLSGMRFVGVPLRDDLDLDLQQTLARSDRAAALVFLAYPNNPTGVLYDEEQVAQIIRAAPGLVVLDEAYHVYARRSFLPRIAEFENLAVMRTVSKMSLAGLRLGYLVARPEWTAEFNKVRQVYNVNVLTQAAASSRSSTSTCSKIRRTACSPSGAASAKRSLRSPGRRCIRRTRISSWSAWRIPIARTSACAPKACSCATSTARTRCSPTACASRSAPRRKTVY
jgi:histidinol-phosphate aminotransferase